jgi:hypothetical protein
MATDVRTAGRPARFAHASIARPVAAFVGAHPVWAVFLLALVVRGVVVVGLTIAHPTNTFAPDATLYSWMAGQTASGHTAQWAPYYHDLYTQTAAFLTPLSWIYVVFGLHPALGEMYVGLLGAATAAFAVGVGLEVLPKGWALAAGFIVALLPSQIVWSSLLLKDASVWFALSGLALTIAVAARSRGVRLLASGLIAGGFLIMLGYLRDHSLVVAAWALMLAALFGSRVHWTRRVAGAVALGVLIPWLVFNLGPAGVTLTETSYTPSYYRGKQSFSATSAIAAASNNAPSTVTAGEVSADIAHLPKGLSAMLIQPYPLSSGGSQSLKLARLADVIWYPVVLLGLLGLTALRPRHLRVMAFPLLVGGVLLILYALTEGSVGTALRHRAEFEWVVALLASFGLMRLAAWRSGRGPIRLRRAPA